MRLRTVVKWTAYVAPPVLLAFSFIWHPLVWPGIVLSLIAALFGYVSMARSMQAKEKKAWEDFHNAS